ncbi:MAG: DNA polymerase IV [archaeon]|nr:DNA polymerase IV [archaeon]
MSRIILHVDLDCFFAAVEARDNPEYRGKPVIIGANPKAGMGRGVISTCSYEARKYGLHSAMPISQAYELCPHGIYLRGSFSKYYKASNEVMTILNSYSDIFKAAGIDEAYLDISDQCEDYSDVKKIANSIRKEVFYKVGITCSVGCGPTKTIAKIASDFNKPNGITLVEPNCVKMFLQDMDITKIPGIGKKSKIHYNSMGIRKIGDFYKLGHQKLIGKFGKNGNWIWDIINGQGNGIVMESGPRKSIGKERTFSRDKSDINEINKKLMTLNQKIHIELKEKKVLYKTITLKIRFQGFDTYTRAKSISRPMRNENLAFDIIIDLLKKFRNDNRKIRLIGIRFSGLEEENNNKQATLFDFMTNYNTHFNTNPIKLNIYNSIKNKSI